MRLKTLLRSLPLLLGLALCPSPIFAQGGSGGGAGPSAHRPNHGPVAGAFDLPSKDKAGHLRGKLLASGKKEVFAISGRIERAKRGAAHGIVRGHATVLNGPRKGQRFPRAGSWKGDGRGKGSFQAKIIHKRKGASSSKVLVDMRGAYLDLAPHGKAGVFQGRWKRHR